MVQFFGPLSTFMRYLPINTGQGTTLHYINDSYYLTPQLSYVYCSSFRISNSALIFEKVDLKIQSNFWGRQESTTRDFSSPLICNMQNS